MNRPRKHNRDLPPCVYLRHGTYYYVKRGKWLRLGQDRRAALMEYARLEGRADGSVADLVDRFMPKLIERSAPATRDLYEVAARHVKHAFADFTPDQVTPGDVHEFMDQRSKTPNMANRCLWLISRVFALAVQRNIVPANPAASIDRLPVGKRTRRITAREYAAIYDHASPRLRVVMDLCALTGQRVGDVLKLRRADLTDDGVYFRQAKTGAELVVAWKPELKAATDAAKALHGRVASLYVVPGRGALPLAYMPIFRDWQTACIAAKVADAHIHDLRALAGTVAKADGRDPKALLGHKSARMTERYLRDRELPIVDGPSMAAIRNGAKQR